jgi:DNA-binding NtrC family response regulator
MTDRTPQQRVLLVGKSQLVLDSTVAGLRELGYAAEATNNFADVTGQFDVRHVDLVVFGGQVPGDRKAELMREISAINPQAIFVQGLAGIPGLIIQQVRGAFAADHQTTDSTPTYQSGDRAVRLTLAQPTDVKMTAWWQTSFVPPDPRSDSVVVLEKRLAAGEHSIPLPDAVPDRAAFASVEVGNAIYAFAVATQ